MDSSRGHQDDHAELREFHAQDVETLREVLRRLETLEGLASRVLAEIGDLRVTVEKLGGDPRSSV